MCVPELFFDSLETDEMPVLGRMEKVIRLFCKNKKKKLEKRIYSCVTGMWS